MILTFEDKNLFNKIIRAEKDFKQLSSSYSNNQISLFDCKVYSQNFSYLINQLNSRIANDTFEFRPIKEKRIIIKALKYFIKAYNLIEKLRMERSCVQIFINEYIFSEN